MRAVFLGSPSSLKALMFGVFRPLTKTKLSDKRSLFSPGRRDLVERWRFTGFCGIDLLCPKQSLNMDLMTTCDACWGSKRVYYGL